MAIVLSGNSAFVDAVGIITDSPTTIHSIVFTGTVANAVLVLNDSSNAIKKIELRLAAVGTQMFHFEEAPLFFSGGITVTTATNAAATIIFTRKAN